MHLVEEIALPILTKYSRLERNDENQSKETPRTPLFSNLESRISCFKVSKSLDKSISKVKWCFLLSSHTEYIFPRL